jgi:hypothetical protein
MWQSRARELTSWKRKTESSTLKNETNGPKRRKKKDEVCQE